MFAKEVKLKYSHHKIRFNTNSVYVVGNKASSSISAWYGLHVQF